MTDDGNQTKRAEDILSDDSLSESLIKGEIQEEEFQEEELFLADRIHKAISANKITLGKNQKNLLDQRIIESIRRSKRNKTVAWFGSAAALLVMVGLTIFFQLQSQSDISDFVSGISVRSDSELTQLMLSGKKIIQISLSTLVDAAR